ncbi:MAG: nucleotidyltransferase family protein [bacterium]|nr:nucleotidyltransferase family protein [bacterium]
MIEIEGLHPPEPHFTPELRWVLEAAFATGSSSPEPGFDPTRAWADARRLALTERIGARRKARELPGELRDDFRRAQAGAAAIGLLYEKTAREVATVAAKLETPVVFLKGLALHLAGCVPVGARSFSDIDILVPKERAEAIFEELLERDFSCSPAEATEQHLPILQPPEGGSLEVHFALRGVQLVGDRPAGFEDLADRDSLLRLEEFPGSTCLPSPSLLAAHILVHGFQQHLLRPTTYPLFRMIADLIDLVPDKVEWSDLVSVWQPAIGHAVSPASLEATRQLCEALRAGHLPDTETQPTSARLLGHLLAGSMNPDYAESLSGAYLRNRLSEAYRRGELGRYLKRKIRPFFGRPRLSRPT